VVFFDHTISAVWLMLYYITPCAYAKTTIPLLTVQ